MGTYFGHLYLQVASAQVRSYRARLGHINTQTRKDTNQHMEHHGTHWTVSCCWRRAEKRQSGQGWWQECVGSTELLFVNGFRFALGWSTLRRIQYGSASYMYTLRLANGHVRPAWCCKIVVEARYSTWLEGRGLPGCPTVAKQQNTRTHFFECLHMNAWMHDRVQRCRVELPNWNRCVCRQNHCIPSFPQCFDGIFCIFAAAFHCTNPGRRLLLCKRDNLR